MKQTTKQTIFAVEDDSSLQELYRYSLENEYDCTCFGDGNSFFAALTDDSFDAKNPPDLILLDIMLPSEDGVMDGFAILSRLKSDRRTSHIPVIMVSAKDEEISKVKGLNMGADDYIAKPFGILELMARIKANLRKNKQAAPDNIVYKDIAIDLARHQVNANGRLVQTTLKEYRLLCLLCTNAEKVQTRKSIFQEVWGESFIGETRTLDMHIKELRRKLSEAESEAVVQTVRGVGYLIT